LPVPFWRSSGAPARTAPSFREQGREGEQPFRQDLVRLLRNFDEVFERSRGKPAIASQLFENAFGEPLGERAIEVNFGDRLVRRQLGGRRCRSWHDEFDLQSAVIPVQEKITKRLPCPDDRVLPMVYEVRCRRHFFSLCLSGCERI
jgi:hypothetical protein